MRRMVVAALVAVMILSGSLVAAQGGDPPALVVDAGADLGPISPYLYGGNISPLSAVPVDLMEAAQAARITWLRFPGGRWADQNNLQHFQVDMFIRLCEQLGAEPAMVARLENGTPEAAAELVRYTNIEKGYGVRYWSVGNEPNLFDDYTTVMHNEQWRAIAEAMLEVDPDIILFGPDTSQYAGDPAVDPRDPEGRDWVREFLLTNGDLVDVVAVHRYPFPRSQANPVTTIDELRQNPPQWDHLVASLRALVLETTGREIPVAVTEASSHWSATIGGEATPDSHFHAIWWADVLGRLVRARPEIAGYFELQTPSSRGAFGLLGSYDIRPTYYVYLLYQRFGTELVSASTEDDYDVSIYAARREDGALTLMVVNLDDTEQTRTLTLSNFEPGGAAEIWRLDAGHNAEQIDSAEIGDGATLTLPPQSVTLVVIPS